MGRYRPKLILKGRLHGICYKFIHKVTVTRSKAGPRAQDGAEHCWDLHGLPVVYLFNETRDDLFHWQRCRPGKACHIGPHFERVLVRNSVKWRLNPSLERAWGRLEGLHCPLRRLGGKYACFINSHQFKTTIYLTGVSVLVNRYR